MSFGPLLSEQTILIDWLIIMIINIINSHIDDNDYNYKYLIIITITINKKIYQQW